MKNSGLNEELRVEWSEEMRFKWMIEGWVKKWDLSEGLRVDWKSEISMKNDVWVTNDANETRVIVITYIRFR